MEKQIKIKSTNEFLTIKKSQIPKAGFGAFASSTINKGTKIGEYQGKLLDQKAYEKLSNQLYIFEVAKKNTKGNYKTFYIDAAKKAPGRELRFINGAFGKKQKKLINVEAYQYREKIFYRSTKNIKAGEELIIDYGDSYWV
jgi:uncharacterized protein